MHIPIILSDAVQPIVSLYPLYPIFLSLIPESISRDETCRRAEPNDAAVLGAATRTRSGDATLPTADFTLPAPVGRDGAGQHGRRQRSPDGGDGGGRSGSRSGGRRPAVPGVSGDHADVQQRLEPCSLDSGSRTNGFTCGFWNVGGLMTNQAEIFQKCLANDVTCLSETFVEDGDEIFLDVPRGFSYVACPAVPSTDVNAVRASGGFGIIFNCNRVRVVPSEFRNVENGIFYGPVHLTDDTKVYIISVYRTKNVRSSVFDEHFFDHLDAIMSSLQGQAIIVGGDFNAKVGDLTGALGLVDDAEHLMPQRSTCPTADDAGPNFY